MKKRKKPDHISPKEWADIDSPPLTERELEKMKPLREVFPDLAEFAAKRRRTRSSSQSVPIKKPITLQVDSDVLANYKATGPGWQSRMNEALRRGTKSL